MTERLYAFRAVHPDFRSRNGFVWPFPGGTAEAANPDPTNQDACPIRDGDGLCMATTALGMASGGIPAITVLVCSYEPSDVLGQEPDKIRVSRARVESVHDFPAILRGELPADERGVLPTKANLGRVGMWGANLMDAKLGGAHLRGANLLRADLGGAYLRDADLEGAYLRDAYLRRADLGGAHLRRAELGGTSLRDAHLRDTNLVDAYLMGADLRNANLRGADLRGAYLRDADLRGTHLRGADLEGANLRGTRGDMYTVLPDGYQVTDSGVIERVA